MPLGTPTDDLTHPASDITPTKKPRGTKSKRQHSRSGDHRRRKAGETRTPSGKNIGVFSYLRSTLILLHEYYFLNVVTLVY